VLFACVRSYENRKEEIVTRCFGAIDMGHPYVAHVYSGGDYLIGGEVTLLGKVGKLSSAPVLSVRSPCFWS